MNIYNLVQRLLLDFVFVKERKKRGETDEQAFLADVYAYQVSWVVSDKVGTKTGFTRSSKRHLTHRNSDVFRQSWRSKDVSQK